jgi:hypothetical protein
LSVELVLLSLRDVAAMRTRISALLGANCPIILVQRARLSAGNFAFFALLMDAAILVGEAAIHLDAARVMPLPAVLGICSGRNQCNCTSDKDELN